MSLELKGIESKLKEYLERRLEQEGPVAERALWGWTMQFFAPQLKISTANLAKSYKMLYGRKIGAKTAEANILNNLRIILSSVKKSLLHTEKKIILGRQRMGRIFYARGQEGKIAGKIKKLVAGTGSRAEEVLKGLKRGPFPITPSHKKAVNMLEYYGLVETKKLGGKLYAVPEGQEGVVELKEAKEVETRRFPSHFRVWEPFKAGIWILKDGPAQKTIKFDMAAWDPENKIFYVALIKPYICRKDIADFREKITLLHLPAKAVVFCETLSNEAKKYAENWGIEIRLGGF